MKNRLPTIIGLGSFIIALTTLSALTRPFSVIAAECVGVPSGVRAVTGPGSGQVTVSWDGVTDANRYAVVYGTKSGSYIYGGDPIGEASSRRYTVNSLQPGVRYYFRVVAKHDTCAGPWSGEVQAMAGGGVSMPQGSPAVLQPSSAAQTVTDGTPLRVMKAGPVGKQNFWAKSGPNPGEVTIYWQDADSANNYHLMYGEQAGSYTYGALNIGNSHWFTVRQLSPGKTYHFALVALLNDRPLYTTQSVGVSAYMTPPPVEPINQTMELTPQGGTMYQQSVYDDYDDDEIGEDDEDEPGDSGDEDELYGEDDEDADEDEDEDNTQGYMMNQEEAGYPVYAEDEQMAQQDLMDPQESRTGSSYDPLFE